MALKFMRRGQQVVQEEAPQYEEDNYSERENVGGPAPESSVELQTFLVSPKAHDTFKHIHQDMTLSYLNGFEITAIRNIGDLVSLCDHLGIKNARDMFLHDMYVVLGSARSRGGFERKMVATHIFKQQIAKDKEQKKKLF